jgi:hypothetical protein
MSILSVGMLNTKGQYNKWLKPSVCWCDLQPHFANKGFGKLSYLAGSVSAWLKY